MLCLAWKLDIHKPGKFMGIQRKESVASCLGTSLDLHEWAPSCCNKRIGAQEANYFHLNPDTSIFFFYPKLSAQVMPFSASTAENFHCSWAVFISKSSMEKIRRPNLYLSLAKGGIGRINVDLKSNNSPFSIFSGQTGRMLFITLVRRNFYNAK